MSKVQLLNKLWKIWLGGQLTFFDSWNQTINEKIKQTKNGKKLKSKVKNVEENEDEEEVLLDALNQIKEKEYISTLRYKQKKLISIIGLVFKGKEVFMKSEVVWKWKTY